jgi:hypothetical protein
MVCRLVYGGPDAGRFLSAILQEYLNPWLQRGCRGLRNAP